MFGFQTSVFDLSWSADADEQNTIMSCSLGKFQKEYKFQTINFGLLLVLSFSLEMCKIYFSNKLFN